MKPSQPLWTAAIGGLAVLACQSGDDHDHDTPEDTDVTDDTDAPEDTPEYDVTSTTSRPDLTFQQMADECAAAGGMMQTHATCAGNNACRGMSFNKWSKDFTHHTCRGLNSCGGASCVLLAEDRARPAADLYDQLCGSMCHGSDFTIYAPPGGDLDEARARFEGRTDRAIASIIAFGIAGHNENGSAYANMPAFHARLSLAELEALVDYVRSLPGEPANYEISGQTEDFTDAG
mgnify:CR=1 FL=1